MKVSLMGLAGIMGAIALVGVMLWYLLPDKAFEISSDGEMVTVVDCKHGGRSVLYHRISP